MVISLHTEGQTYSALATLGINGHYTQRRSWLEYVNKQKWLIYQEKNIVLEMYLLYLSMPMLNISDLL